MSTIAVPDRTTPTPAPSAEALTSGPPEVSVVLPCLNEADTVGICVEKAIRTLREHAIAGEVIVADNGSTDGSADIAARLGARIVPVAERGYGHALMGGIGAARGKFIIMGDADDSYSFTEIPKFVEQLRRGFALVQGCRFPSGGGTIQPKAMPWLHRWIGNPALSFLARTMFRVPAHDVYCGMRGFTRELYDGLNLRCTGMEFATEMLIKASLMKASHAEVPITLYPDGRKNRSSHLRTFRDGWRTLRFYLLYSPRWLFLYPGFALILCGIIGYLLALPGVTIAGATLDAHTLLVSSLALFLGYQSILFALCSKTFAVAQGLLPEDPRLQRFFQWANLEKGLLAGAAACCTGFVLLLVAVNDWRLAGFGPLDYARTMRWVIPSVTLCTLGSQTILSSFLVSILGLRRR
jgi:glycosyltransferase involved in cell wall biosynthesis